MRLLVEGVSAVAARQDARPPSGVLHSFGQVEDAGRLAGSAHA